MAKFLFPPDSIERIIRFKPIKIDIQQGVNKIVDEEYIMTFS